jgi:hypothetical protein
MFIDIFIVQELMNANVASDVEDQAIGLTGAVPELISLAQNCSFRVVYYK